VAYVTGITSGDKSCGYMTNNRMALENYQTGLFLPVNPGYLNQSPEERCRTID